MFQDLTWYHGDNQTIHQLQPILYSIDKKEYQSAEHQIDDMLRIGSSSTGELLELKWDIAYDLHKESSWAIQYYKNALQYTPNPRIFEKIQLLEWTLSSESHVSSDSGSSDTHTGSETHTGSIEVKKRIAEIEQYQKERKGAIDLTLTSKAEESKNINTLIQDLQNDQNREIHDW
jgi:hypothetical protein